MSFFILQNHNVCQTVIEESFILQEETCKLSLPSGIPQTVEELKIIVKETFAIEQDFRLQFQDRNFDGQFFTLLETNKIKDWLDEKTLE